MTELISEVSDRYDLVVIDTPPTGVVSDAIPLIRQVSGVVVVSRLGRSSRVAAQHLRRQLESLDAPTLGVVANAVKARQGGEYYGYYGYGYGPEAAKNGQASEAAVDSRSAT